LEQLLLGASHIVAAFNPLGMLSAIFYFIITIFVLVSIHEFGHFIAGRIFGMRVPVYSIGMGQRVFGWNKIDGLTFGALRAETEIQLTDNTDYRLSALPIGGYAKIEGMIDETQNEALPNEIQPWEFRAKPWWQKSIVILAGVIMNTLLAWGIFTGQFIATGEDQRATTTVGSVEQSSQSAKGGVMPGDKIVSIEQERVTTWDDFDKAAFSKYIGHDFQVTFERNGQPYNVLYRTGAMKDPSDVMRAVGLESIGVAPPIVAEVVSGMPADKAGIKAEDQINRINGDTILSVESLISHIGDNANRAVTLSIVRNKKVMALQVTPNSDGKIGIQPVPGEYSGPIKHMDYSLPQAIGAAWQKMVFVGSLTVTMVGKVISGKLAVSSALGGPVKIAQMASKSAAGGSNQFITFLALLSISLAMLNVLPIPALDGGHLVIILIEAAIGHELSQRFKLGFQRAGVAILLSLMVFMVINDIRSL
jgi:regulator of sigma E protease